MVEILINGNKVDILDRSSINIRLNNVVYNPTEISGEQAEYSFSFNLPTTPNNNKIFNFAENLDSLGKFGKTYKCELYSDDVLIFKGNLVIQSIEKGFYNVNLVNIKINTIEDIFGEMTMNLSEWNIPFIGVESINEYNAKDEGIYFPLVSYGCFQKKPLEENESFNTYTDIFNIDKYNKWYVESFNPSVKVIELIKRFFEQKGFTVKGDIYLDEILNNLYMSTNLASEQIPSYNLGNEHFGKVNVIARFDNFTNVNTAKANRATALLYDLSFPYQRVNNYNEEAYNFGTVDIYDIWSSENTEITKADKLYLFDDFSNCIVIPNSGLYKISMNVNINLIEQNYLVNEEVTPSAWGDVYTKLVLLNNSLKDDMPIEIQLVRNSDECELIHGAEQWYYEKGDRSKKITWNTAYPHENLYSSENPSADNGRFSMKLSDRNKNIRTSGRNYRTAENLMLGYMPNTGQMLAFDPYVNSNFIMGFSTLSGGTPSVIKNGYSWNKTVGDQNVSGYDCVGYFEHTSLDKVISSQQTTVNKNLLIDGPLNSCTLDDHNLTGMVSGIVYLEKDDILMLKAVAKHLTNGNVDIRYKFNTAVNLTLEAYSPNKNDEMNWKADTKFNKNLQIGEFLNKETKVSDFVNNFLKAFNINYTNEGKTVTLNRNKKPGGKYAIKLFSGYSLQTVDYPGSMLVKYKIDTEEYGFVQSVPKDKIDLQDWENYGDYGSDLYTLGNNEEKKEILLTNSYCWYSTFKIFDSEDKELGSINIPVIAKDENMILETYEMKKDGKSLPLRFWFRGTNTGFSVNVNGKYAVNIYDTKNINKIELSYKKGDTIIEKYFDILKVPNNKIVIESYLTPELYLLLKNGAKVLFDDNIYRVSELLGYDPMNLNKTEITII